MSATEEQIIAGMTMVRRLARRYRNTSLGYDDACGAGSWRWWRRRAASILSSACRSPARVRPCARRALGRPPRRRPRSAPGRGSALRARGALRDRRPARPAPRGAPRRARRRHQAEVASAHGTGASRVWSAELRDRRRHGRQRVSRLATPGDGAAARACGGGSAARLTADAPCRRARPGLRGLELLRADTAAPGSMGSPAARVRRRSRWVFSRREPGPPPGGLASSAGDSPRG